MTTDTCQRCGSPVEPGALFCSKCGLDVSAVQVDPAETLAATEISQPEAVPSGPTRSTMRQALRDATLGEYEILNELGRGGMATVFLAHDISLDRKVAIKVMSPHLLEGEGMAERFKLEARTAAQLSHPHIIPIYAVKETADTLYFVMKYVEGRELGDIIKKSGQLPISMVTDILSKVGAALGYAHRRDVVHRDIKPANIMIDEEGTPIVTDFGIAKVAETSGLTMTGSTIGTPSYMSPEQCEAKQVTGASDQYSLGVVAFEMLTGSLPFSATSPVTIMYKHVHEELPPLLDFRPDCPPEIVEAVTRMLAKKPADRWPSMEAAIQKLGTSGGSSMDSLEPVRSQLIALARESGSDELLAQLSDPSLPTAGGVTGPRTGGGAASGGSSRKVWAGLGAAAVVVTVGALAVLQPWAAATPAGPAESNAAGQPVAQVDEPTGPGGDVVPGEDGTPDEGAPDDGADGDQEGGQAANGDAPTENTADDDPVEDTPPPPVNDDPPPPEQVRVASVTVEGVSGTLLPDDRVALTARATDDAGATVPSSVVNDCRTHGWSACGIQWSSDDPSVARVGSDGQLVAVGSGRTTVRAVIGGRTGTLPVAVGDVPVGSVRIEGGDVSIPMGQSRTLRASVLAAAGTALEGRDVSWSSDATSIATVNGSGMVEALRPGTATVTARSGGQQSSVQVTVEAPSASSAIGGLLADFERAFESGNVDEVARVVTGMSATTRQNLSASFGAMSQIDAVLSEPVVTGQGNTATAEVEAEYRFVADGNQMRAPITLIFSLARDNGVWRIVGMDSRDR